MSVSMYLAIIGGACAIFAVGMSTVYHFTAIRQHAPQDQQSKAHRGARQILYAYWMISILLLTGVTAGLTDPTAVGDTTHHVTRVLFGLWLAFSCIVSGINAVQAPKAMPMRLPTL